jgi:hypothetical protein
VTTRNNFLTEGGPGDSEGANETYGVDSTARYTRPIECDLEGAVERLEIEEAWNNFLNGCKATQLQLQSRL